MNRIDLTDIDLLDFVGKQESQFIVPFKEFGDDIHERFENGVALFGDDLPWIKTHDKFRLRPGEVSIWAGVNGHGKSIVTSHVAAHLCKTRKVLIASLEMPIPATGHRMIRQIAGNSKPPTKFIDDIINWTNERIFLYDELDTVESERILGLCIYAFSQLGINHIFIDSLMKCGIAPDDYSKQKSFIDELCAIAKNYNMNIHLVAHMRKPPVDKRYIPNRYDIAGGSDITNQADNIFICWSDVEKNRERAKPEHMQDKEIMSRPCQIFAIEKQREGEDSMRFALNFDPRSLQMIDGKRIDYWENFK